jgi:hypothetical protein
MKIFKNKLQVLVTLVFLGYLGWWFSFQHVVVDQGKSVQWFGGTYGIVALIGAIIGFLAARRWGGFKTLLGKALMFFSLSLLFQEAGQLILTYYIYGSKIQIPYPSWGDVAYFGSTLSYICGAYFLSKTAGIRFSLKVNKYKFVAFLVPAALLATSFFVFLHHHQYDWHKPLTVFLDLGYPIGDAVYISLAIVSYLLTRKMLGGVMRSAVLILLLAFVAQYISDFTFLYQSSRGTYLSGKYDDLAYFVTYFIAATAMIRFNQVYSDLRKKTAEMRASSKSGVES